MFAFPFVWHNIHWHSVPLKIDFKSDTQLLSIHLLVSMSAVHALAEKSNSTTVWMLSNSLFMDNILFLWSTQIMFPFSFCSNLFRTLVVLNGGMCIIKLCLMSSTFCCVVLCCVQLHCNGQMWPEVIERTERMSASTETHTRIMATFIIHKHFECVHSQSIKLHRINA